MYLTLVKGRTSLPGRGTAIAAPAKESVRRNAGKLFVNSNRKLT